MALTTGNVITAGDYNAVRQAVERELKRRKYNPNLSSYVDTGASAYAGSAIVSRNQGAQLVAMANRITNQGYNAGAGAIIYQLNTLFNNYNNVYIYDDERSTTTHCTASCAGLCHGGCAVDCEGCAGTCTSCSGCRGGCTSCSGCSGNCSGCRGGCDGCDGCGGCDGGCQGHCTCCHGGCEGSNTWWHG